MGRRHAARVRPAERRSPHGRPPCELRGDHDVAMLEGVRARVPVTRQGRRRKDRAKPNTKAKPRPGKRRVRPLGPARRRYCHLCKEKIVEVDYKDHASLRRFVSERGKIKPPRNTGTRRRHQRQVAEATKRAREMALLPYAVTASGEQRRRPPPVGLTRARY